MTTLRFSSSSQTEERKRRSRGSGEVQTRQEQASMGTPWEVPVPRKVRRIGNHGGGWKDGRVSFLGMSLKIPIYYFVPGI